MSGLSRRGLFGASLGAALAGPPAVQSVLEGDFETDCDYAHSPGGPGLAWNEPDSDWLTRELEEAISEKSQFMANAPVARTVRPEHFRIDGLRSVSPSNRARMIAEASVKFEHDNRIGYVDRRIAELKEKLGLLGKLL